MKKLNIIDSKKWIKAFKKAVEYPQVRPDSASNIIDSKMWLEAAKKAVKSPKVRPDEEISDEKS